MSSWLWIGRGQAQPEGSRTATRWLQKYRGLSRLGWCTRAPEPQGLVPYTKRLMQVDPVVLSAAGSPLHEVCARQGDAA